MDEIVGLIGREAMVNDLVAEIRKGKHVILSGPGGIGKSAALEKETAVFRAETIQETR
jgi:MoxR-like ATPase